MRLPVGRHDGRRGLIVQVMRAVLAVAMLIPIATLYFMVWRSNADLIEYADGERDGITYVSALVSVEMALVESQTAVLTGQTITKERLTRAIDAVVAVDVRFGGTLRTHERWAELRAKIEALPSKASDREAEFEAFEEAADLLLNLLEKVRISSQLIRDPYADTYHLQDAAAQELPQSILRSSRLVFSALLTSQMPPADQSENVADVLKLGEQVVANMDDVSEDVRQTVDTTKSRTLGGNLITPLDRYRMAIEGLVPVATAKKGSVLSISSADLDRTWVEMQTASAALMAAILTQLDTLIVDRIDSLKTDTAIATGVMVLALLLSGVPPTVSIVRGRRRRVTRPDATAPVAVTAPPAGALVGAASGAAAFGGPRTQPGTDRSVASSWERSGAR